MDFNTRLFWTLSGWTVLQLSGNPGNPKQQAHTGTQTTKSWHCSFLFIASHHTWQHLDCIQMHTSHVKHWTPAFPHEVKAGFQVSLVSSLKTLTLSSYSLCVLLHHVGLLNWRSEKGLQLCVNSLTWISLLRENQSSSRGVCISSHPWFLHVWFLCVCRPLQLVLEHEHSSWSLRLGSAEEVDKVIAHIGSCLHRICPAGVPV